MEFLVVLFFIWLAYQIVKYLFNEFRERLQPSSRRSPPPSTSGSETHVSEKRTRSSSSHTYRPSVSRPGSGIVFEPVRNQSVAKSTLDHTSLSDINDAFTGRRLDTSQILYECGACHVFYQEESIAVLREANGSRCMACGSTQIAVYGVGRKANKARNYTPDAVTLDNYREHIGHVITFTGIVYEVKQSRRGSDYAVMFERASWTKGLKMVAFKGGVRKLGGASVLKGYAHRRLTVRGLLIVNPVYGPQIIVDDPTMIIRVE